MCKLGNIAGAVYAVNRLMIEVTDSKEQQNYIRGLREDLNANRQSSTSNNR